MGLALPRESVGEVKERRKPDRRWQNREIGGGFPQTSWVARASRLGSTCRGKALRIGKVVLFDEGAAEAVLVPRKYPGRKLREAAGRDRERQRSDVSLAHGRKRQAEVAPPEGGARICPRREANRAVYGSAEAGGAPSSARPAGVGLSQGGPASHGRTRHLPLSSERRRGSILRSAQRKLRARKSNGPRVLVSRVGCRGRREASSPRHRGEPRGKPRLHGVARCGGGS